MSLPMPPFQSPIEELLFQIYAKLPENESMQLIKERGIITLTDTQALQQQSGTDTLLALVKDTALFAFEPNGIPNGTDIFPASGGGVWRAVIKKSVSLPDPVFSATFQNNTLPVLGLYQDIRVETSDWLDQDHPTSPKSMLMNIQGNAITAAVIAEPNTGLSIFAIQSGTSNAGIQIDDQGNFLADFYTPASLNINYTGDQIPNTIIVAMYYNVNDGLLYYVAGNNSLYTFNPVTFVNTGKIFAGASALRFLAYNASANRMVIGGTTCLVSLEITPDTYKVYTKTSGNYTGDLLPATGITDMAMINDVVWFARGITIVPADNGLIKFNLTTEVCTRYTSANGLASTRVGSVAALGNYLFIRYVDLATTPLGRFNSIDNTVVNYGNATANYSGDLIPAEVANVMKLDPEHQILLCNTSTKIWIAKLDAALALTVSEHTTALGYALPNFNFSSLILRRILPDAVDSRLMFYFTAASSSGGPGIQVLKLYEDLHPVKLVYDKFGLNLSLLDRKVLGKNSVAVKSLFDEFKANIDLSVSQLDQEKDNTIIEISNDQLLQPNNRSIYYTYVYDGPADIVVSLQIVNPSVNRITFIQRGAGKITITNAGGANNLAGGKLITNGQWDSIEILRGFSNGTGQREFIGK